MPARACAVAAGDRVKILLVDDEPRNVLALEAMLAAPDRELVGVYSPEDALRRLLREDFALIILDVHMPGMSGFDVAELIKRRERTRSVPIIFLTAGGIGSRPSRGYLLGAVDYLQKPIEPEVLRAKVDVFVDLWRKTEQVKRQAEEIRRAGERRYKNLAESVPDIVWAASPEGDVTFITPRWTELTGFPAEAAMGEGFLAHIHPDDRAATRSAWREAVAAGRPYEVEQRVRRADGGYVWLLARAVPDRDATGKIAGWNGTSTDIHDLKAARAAAESAHRRSSYLAEASRALAATVEWRDALDEVARRAVPEFADDASASILAGDEGVPLGKEHAPCAQQEEQEARLRVPILSRGRCYGTFAFVRRSREPFASADVTMAEDLGRRAAAAIENARLHREAREAIALRDEFLSIASHELRTPLTPLQLHLQSILRKLKTMAAAGRGAGPEVESAVETAQRQVQRLGKLVDELLDVSRIRLGTLRLETEEVDLARLAREVVARSGIELARAGCEARVDAPPEPIVLRLDALRIDQVLTNLVSNALKYGPRKPIEIGVAREGSRAVIRVRDHGIGIARDDLGRIFERFERAVPSRSYGGLGLGLYIAHQIVEAHGGKISAESEPGSGATFTVELPLGQPARAAEAHPRAERGHFRSS